MLLSDAFTHLIGHPHWSSAAPSLTNVWHVEAERADRWTPRLFGRSPLLLIKSSSCSWPCVAERTLFWRWQFMQQDWAAIHHSWQVKPCAQSVYIHNYKASTCPWAARGSRTSAWSAPAGGRRELVRVCGLYTVSGGNKSTVIGVCVCVCGQEWLKDRVNVSIGSHGERAESSWGVMILLEGRRQTGSSSLPLSRLGFSPMILLLVLVRVSFLESDDGWTGCFSVALIRRLLYVKLAAPDEALSCDPIPRVLALILGIGLKYKRYLFSNSCVLSQFWGHVLVGFTHQTHWVTGPINIYKTCTYAPLI